MKAVNHSNVKNGVRHFITRKKIVTALEVLVLITPKIR